VRGQKAGAGLLASLTGAAAEAARPRWRAGPAGLGAWVWSWLPVPTPLLVLSALLTCGVVLAWDDYLVGDQPHRRLLLGLALLMALALTCERYRTRLPDLRALAIGRRQLVEAAATAALTVALLGAGLWYRLTWPTLLYAGDSVDYETLATLGAAAHRYVLVPWRTPGYAFPLTLTYELAGTGNHGAIHTWQIGVSLLTALVVMAIAYLVTRSRALAVVALAVACLAYPMAVPAAYLMSEAPAMFLVALAALLVVAVLRGRAVGAAMLALGPVLALAYETRPALLPGMAVLGAGALVAPRAGWRLRLVLVAGVALTLAPVVMLNAQSPYRVVTASSALDPLGANLDGGRYALYWSAPNAPERLEQLRAAIIADGAGTEFWISLPSASVAAFNRARVTAMEHSILDNWPSFAELSLRRLPLTLREDQAWDLTYDRDHPGVWLVLIDAILALALVAAGTWIKRDRFPMLALLALTVAALIVPLALFHVEPRYSLAALPLLIVLALMGARSIAGLVGAGVAPLRAAGAPLQWPPLASGARPRWRPLATGAALAAAVALAVPVSEVAFWPGLPDEYAPAPTLGQYHVASCSVGHQLLMSVAWQPGTSLVVAGGANGSVRWDVRTRSCPWHLVVLDNQWDLSFSADGRRLALGSFHAATLDPVTGAASPPTVGNSFLAGNGAEILSVSLDPTGDRFAFAAPGVHVIGVHEVTTTDPREPRATLPASPIAVRWSPDGSTIAVAASDGRVRLYDPSLRPLGDVPLPHEPTALAWSPESGMLAAGDVTGRLYLLDVRDATRPRVVRGAQGHRGEVHGLAWSPDGAALASGGSDHVARVWDPQGLTLARTLAGDTATVWAVSWAADSRRLVTASADGTLAVWSAR